MDQYHKGAEGHMPTYFKWNPDCKNKRYDNGTYIYSCIE